MSHVDPDILGTEARYNLALGPPNLANDLVISRA